MFDDTIISYSPLGARGFPFSPRTPLLPKVKKWDICTCDSAKQFNRSKIILRAYKKADKSPVYIGTQIISINNYKTARYIYNISFFNSFSFLKIDLLKNRNIFVQLNFLQFLNYNILKISFLSSYEICTKLHLLYYSAQNGDLYGKKSFERFRTEKSTV